jgi:uncharacterized FAD-dependent dehydrogenase
MLLRLRNLELPVDQPEASLTNVIAERLGRKVEDIRSWRILRKSLDARTRDSLKFVYSTVVDLPDDDLPASKVCHWLSQCPTPATGGVVVELFEESSFENPPTGHDPLADPPVIVGSGPGGLLAAYFLALRGFQPLVIERGEPVKERVPAIRAFDRGGSFDRENNYLFGEGGAGTFSDGKLTCRMSGPDVDWVLERFVECGGKSSLRYENRPHLGSNRLPLLVRNFRRKIDALGGRYRFRCKLEDIDIADDRVRGVMTSSGYIRTQVVVLAIGHSARDTYEMLLRRGVPMRSKAFQLGLRIEQPQEQVNLHKYGRPEYERLLGAADYTLVARGQPDLFTFCMCAGGIIIPSISEPEMFCTNGMSNSRHDTPFANSGVMVTLDPADFGGDHPLAGVELQRRYESAAFRLGGGSYFTPIQRAAVFLASRVPDSREKLLCSYKRGSVPADLSAVIPPMVANAIRHGLPIMDRQFRGDFLRNAILVGPEMRGSSPVRIDRDPDSRQTPNIAGLYPVGEGAGYAGGIVSAAVDGLRTAKVVVKQFAPLHSSGERGV